MEYKARNLLGAAEEDEAERHNGGAANVVGNVRDGEVQKLFDGVVVRSARVGEADAEHTAYKKDNKEIIASLEIVMSRKKKKK